MRASPTRARSADSRRGYAMDVNLVLSRELEPVDVDEIAAWASESGKEGVPAGGRAGERACRTGPGLPPAGVGYRYAGDDRAGRAVEAILDGPAAAGARG